MDLATIDERLQQLDVVVERIAANLLDLEQDPTRRFLDSGTPSGTTAAAWSDASRTIRALWQDYTNMVSVLDLARSVRQANTPASAKVVKLSALLDGAALSIEGGTRPVYERALLGERRNVERSSVNETIARMTSAFDGVRAVVAAVAQTWGELEPRLDTARGCLEVLRASDAEFGASADVAIVALSAHIDSVAARAMTDPLSVAAANVVAIEHDVATLVEQRRADEDLAAELHARMRDAHRLLEDTRRAAEDADAIARTVAPKVAGVSAPPLDGNAGTLATELAGIEALVAQRDWRGARRALEHWTEAAASARAANLAIVERGRRALDQRNVLRGRLDASQSKAHALGLAEAASLDQLYHRAHTALYHAPTHLDRAAELVHEYHQAVSTGGDRS